MAKGNKIMNEIVALSKRRGFIFQYSEIYGGINALWDMGPLGVEMKNNIKNFWWKYTVQMRSDVEGLDSSILMHPKIWEASGHIENFTDPLVECRNCHKRFRADEIKGNHCPNCGSDQLTEPKMFNLMFKTFIGPVESAENTIYLRPETAQGIYINYQNVMVTTRQKIPFGIAQIGKAFRNEISPGNFIFRSREFEQMEMQYFVHPDEANRWFEYWRKMRWQWYLQLGIDEGKIHWHQHGENELAHYARDAYDIEFDFPFGRKELEGVHNRGDFDLSRHQQYSGKNLEYTDKVTGEKFIPFIIETSGGVDRCMLAILCDAYTVEPEQKDSNKMRTVLKMHPRISPIKVGVFPLVKKDGMPEIAKEIASELRKRFTVFYDEKDSIGRRYRRQDEAGTPFCVTVDGQTLKDNTVTIRERDTLIQVRVKIDEIAPMIDKYIENWERDKGIE
ncbi:glycine--tRNA ligase [bacterium]|nr:MAG: glycine--tRNA ligase [bacterium]